MSSPRSSTYLILGTVVLMIGLQIVAKYLPGGDSLKLQKPGVTRGDLKLEAESLSVDLAGWTQTKFIPAPSPDELPKGQFWWVHQWHYKLGDAAAVVSLDQLGESNWHELTHCYTGLGWTIEDRNILFDSEQNGAYAVCRMSMDSGEGGILVFSVFFEDGQWVDPPVVDLPRLNALGDDYLSKVGNRVQPIISFAEPDSFHNRALQCQVFVPGLKRVTPDLVAASVQLHLESRKRFRTCWLDHSVRTAVSVR